MCSLTNVRKYLSRKFMSLLNKRLASAKLLSFLFCCGMHLSVSAQPLTLADALTLANQHDLWLTQNNLQQQAILAQKGAVQSRPNPTIGMGIYNVPTDGFALNQEPMTQLKVAVSQQFSRGESTSLKKSQLQAMADQYPWLRLERKASTKVAITNLWLAGYVAHKQIQLIEQNEALFQQLIDISEANYSSVQGSARQQDLLRAQLEVTQIEDRINQLTLQRDAALLQLNEWLIDLTDLNSHKQAFDQFPSSLPSSMISPLSNIPDNLQLLADKLSKHPAILAISAQINAAKSGIELAKQKYSPQWGIEASYGLRNDDPMGTSRADFLSFGIKMDMPIFSQTENDSAISAARLKTESIKTQQRIQLKKMLSEVTKLASNYRQVKKRESRYRSNLLPRARQQAEAAISAYNSANGQFTDVIQAQITHLNARIDYIQIEADLYQLATQINYYFTQSEVSK